MDCRPLDPSDVSHIEKNRGRGKNSSLRKHLRKKGSKNIIDEKRVKIEELRKAQMDRRNRKHEATAEELGPALGRFARKIV